MRNLYDSGVFPRAAGVPDVEILTGFFRNRKTKKGVREGGTITINRAVIRGGMALPAQLLRVIETDTSEFDVEVPPVLAQLGMAIGDDEPTVTRRYRKLTVEFSIVRIELDAAPVAEA